MKKLYLIGILMPMILYGQSDMQNVISSSGNHFNNGSVQISYTIGEAIINTFSREVALEQDVGLGVRFVELGLV